jgi:hypothetical protein
MLRTRLGNYKTSRMKWVGHVNSMEDHRKPKIATQGIPGGEKRRGKPRKRWLENVEYGLR